MSRRESHRESDGTNESELTQSSASLRSHERRSDLCPPRTRDHHNVDSSNARTSPITVVVVDDHEMILQSVVRLFAADPQIVVVGTALTGAQGIDVTKRRSQTSWSSTSTCLTWKRQRRFDNSAKRTPASRSSRSRDRNDPARYMHRFAPAARPGCERRARFTNCVTPFATSMRAGRSPTKSWRRHRSRTNWSFTISRSWRCRRSDRGLRGAGPLATPGTGTAVSRIVPALRRRDRLHRRDRPLDSAKAVHQLSLWPPLSLSANTVDERESLGVRHSRSRSLPIDLGHTPELGVEPEHLVVEITESVLLDDSDTTMKFLTQFNDIGVKLALDDFGTAFSSISYVRRFPFDHLKLDISFTAELPNSIRSMLLVEEILHMAESLRMTGIAEGIERQDQLDACVKSDSTSARAISSPGGVGAPECDVLLSKTSLLPAIDPRLAHIRSILIAWG